MYDKLIMIYIVCLIFYLILCTFWSYATCVCVRWYCFYRATKRAVNQYDEAFTRRTLFKLYESYLIDLQLSVFKVFLSSLIEAPYFLYKNRLRGICDYITFFTLNNNPMLLLADETFDISLCCDRNLTVISSHKYLFDHLFIRRFKKIGSCNVSICLWFIEARRLPT